MEESALSADGKRGATALVNCSFGNWEESLLKKTLADGEGLQAARGN